MAGVIQGSWSDLPVDVLTEIVESLFYVDQIRFRSVCKSWRSNTNPNKHASDKLPWVISFDYDHDCNEKWFQSSGSGYRTNLSCKKSGDLFCLYDPSLKKKYIVKTKLLSGSTVHASKHGWLLLSEKRPGWMPDSFFVFYTPFINKMIQLPQLNMMDGRSLATFSTAPTSPDCSIFVVTVQSKYSNQFWVSTCSPGDKTWTNIPFDGDYGEVDSLAFAGGVFYCLFTSRVMGSFNIELKEWKIHPDLYPGESRLIESQDGNLFTIRGTDFNEKRLFRYDQSEMQWLEVENLDNGMIFYGVTSMLLPAAEEASELANTLHMASSRNRWREGICSSYFHEPPKSRRRPLHTYYYDWIDKSLDKAWIQPLKHT